MKLYDKDENLYIARVTNKPKFSSHRGRTWDVDEKLIDDKKIDFWYDSTWGYNFYFSLNERWYSIPIFGSFKNEGVGNIKKLYTNKDNSI